MFGLALSMLTLAVSVAVFPAVSLAVPVMGWLAPSVATVCGAVHPPLAGMPERLSAQLKVTVTSVLFQPFPLAAGSCVWPIVGASLSICSVMLWPAALLSSRLPALSVLQYVTVWTPLWLTLKGPM